MQRGARVLRRVWRPTSARKPRAETRKEKEAWSGRFSVLAKRIYRRCTGGEKSEPSVVAPPLSPLPCVGGRTRERRVESKGRREEGARGCEPFLRHYVIRRFPRGIPTASTASRETWSQRNALCQVIIILLLLFPFVLHLSTVISDIRRIDSSFLSWRGREEEEISVCFAGGRELVDICGRKLRYISYMGICVYVDSSICV